jgi:hypothetical protein
MQSLKGVHLAFGRVGTKAVSDAIAAHTDTNVVTWFDADRILASPRYYLAGSQRPFVMSYHHLIHFEQFKRLIAQNPSCPIVFSVRDPIANLKSFARTMLVSYICGHYNEIKKLAAQGKFLALAPDTIEQDFAPIVDYWRYWQAIKRSPNMIVDLSDLSEARFVGTMNRICDFLHLERSTPIVWPGQANSEAAGFLLHYRMDIDFLDREMELFFSLTQDDGAVHDAGPGLVLVGTLPSELLGDFVGPGKTVHVHIKADAMLSQSQLARERETFATFVAVGSVKKQLAAKMLEDYGLIIGLVDALHPMTEAAFIDVFHKRFAAGIVEFLRAHPWLEERWQCAAQLKAA